MALAQHGSGAEVAQEAHRDGGYLNAFCQRIKRRRGSGKAIIATARKAVVDHLQNLQKTARSSKISPNQKSN